MFRRIVAKLDIKGPNLVKGIHLEGLRVLGQPEAFSRDYYLGGIDELVYMDVVASLYERNSIHELISKTAENVFIPLTVGGGIRSLDDIKEVLRAGADKVALNTAAVKRPALSGEAASYFGSSTIVVSIEAIRQQDGSYHAFVDNGREETGLEVVAWAKQVEQLGAGEIMLTSVDREGTGKGYDLELVHSVSESVDVPVVAIGGAGNEQHVVDLLLQTGAAAAGAASIFHYGHLSDAREDEDGGPREGNRSFLQSKRTFGTFEPVTVPALKQRLYENKIDCRV